MSDYTLDVVLADLPRGWAVAAIGEGKPVAAPPPVLDEIRALASRVKALEGLVQEAIDQSPAGWGPWLARAESLIEKGMTMTIDTGDFVRHGPTGEEWVVAYVQGDRLAWCGWPEGEARLADCTLLQKASDEYRAKILNELAESTGARARYARHRLGIAEAATA